MCPVHTPDGAPCGLLNHISSKCRPLGVPIVFTENNFKEATTGLDYKQVTNDISIFHKDFVPIMLNGKIVGFSDHPEDLEAKLRVLKIKGQLPMTLEIAYLPKKPFFAGIYMFTGEGRLIREVKHIKTDKIE